jgi:hypothetical protein
MQNSIDTLFILPQYLALVDHSLLQVGLVFQIQGPKSVTLAGKIVHGGTFMATKKKAKKKKH